jgi:hypothetical protein
MYLAINGTEISAYPAEFEVTLMDLDDAESTFRTADGTLTRDRVARKRQIRMTWRALRWEALASILQSMQDEFFEFTYPDPMTGTQRTGTFYAGDRTGAYAFERNGVYWWDGLTMVLTER